jgi:hypothetical protein
MVIGNIYRTGTPHPLHPPTVQYEIFVDSFANLLHALTNRNQQFYLFGDMNLDLLRIKTTPRIAEYVNLLFSFGLLQILTKPTRCTPSSASLIDHIITNVKSQTFSNVILTSQISDHFPIVHFIHVSKAADSSKGFVARDFSATNLAKFKQTLNQISWNFLKNENDTQTAYNIFSDTFNNLYELNFPKKTIKFNRNIHQIEPFMTSGLLISPATKLKLGSTKSRFPTPTNILHFKTYRNVYNSTIRLAKKLYYERLLSKNFKNLRKTWEILRSVMKTGGRSKQNINELLYNGVILNDPAVIACKLNEFFY